MKKIALSQKRDKRALEQLREEITKCVKLTWEVEELFPNDPKTKEGTVSERLTYMFEILSRKAKIHDKIVESLQGRVV